VVGIGSRCAAERRRSRAHPPALVPPGTRGSIHPDDLQRGRLTLAKPFTRRFGYQMGQEPLCSI